MKRLITAALAAGGLVVGLSACDNRPCLAGHEEWTLIAVSTGKSVTTIPEQIFICDKYGKEPK